MGLLNKILLKPNIYKLYKLFIICNSRTDIGIVIGANHSKRLYLVSYGSQQESENESNQR